MFLSSKSIYLRLMVFLKQKTLDKERVCKNVYIHLPFMNNEKMKEWREGVSVRMCSLES